MPNNRNLPRRTGLKELRQRKTCKLDSLPLGEHILVEQLYSQGYMHSLLQQLFVEGQGHKHRSIMLGNQHQVASLSALDQFAGTVAEVSDSEGFP